VFRQYEVPHVIPPFPSDSTMLCASSVENSIGENLQPQSNRTLLVVWTSDLLAKALQLLKYLQNMRETIDILVIDSSSTDGTAEYLRRKVLFNLAIFFAP
jgi:RecA/RadA recombinase